LKISDLPLLKSLYIAEFKEITNIPTSTNPLLNLYLPSTYHPPTSTYQKQDAAQQNATGASHNSHAGNKMFPPWE